MKTHRFTRTEIMLGAEALEKLHRSHVVICGIGGVGSYAAEALGRAGIGSIKLVDFDTICVTNINRQLHALEDTVGRPKAEVMGERLGRINPDADIISVREFISAENIEALLTPAPNYVLDAIDHFTSKVELIDYCRKHDIPVISSMGAATKRDPGKIHVADISQTSKCRMARSLRKMLRQRGISSGVKVVYSTEEFDDQAFVLPTEEEKAAQAGGIIKRVILGSISFIPSIFGLTMAGVVVNDLLERQN